MKKYGWIAIALVLILVGGAAFNEWQKAKAQSAAENLGDQIFVSLNNNDSVDRFTALNEVSAEADAGAVLALLRSSEAMNGNLTEDSKAQLLAIVSNEALPTSYRHLAEFKLLLLEADNLSSEVRMARFEALAVAGAPYRLLASEQMAIIDISVGNKDQALKRLIEILSDGEVTAGLRRRVSQLIVALGGDLSAI